MTTAMELRLHETIHIRFFPISFEIWVFKFLQASSRNEGNSVGMGEGTFLVELRV